MGSWELERDDFIRDRDKRYRNQEKQTKIEKVRSALGELGFGLKDVGPEFVAATVRSMSPNEDVTELVAQRLSERALGVED